MAVLLVLDRAELARLAAEHGRDAVTAWWTANRLPPHDHVRADTLRVLEGPTGPVIRYEVFTVGPSGLVPTHQGGPPVATEVRQLLLAEPPGGLP